MTRTHTSALFYWAFGFVILCGGAVICWQVNVLQTQNASLHWPATTGTIVRSERVHVGHGGSSSSRDRADITYSYQVNGLRCVSRQITLWSPDLSLWVNSSDLQRFVSAHPKESEVTVYYDPKQFGNAVLIPGAYATANKFIMGAAGICVLAAIIGMAASARRRRVLKALLHAPDAQTRTIRVRKSDIEKGLNGFLINFLVAGVFMIPALGLLMIPLLSGPAILLEAPRATPTSRPVTEIVCLLGFLIFIARAARQSRSAQCPLCRNLLNKTAIQRSRCGDCNAHIIFEDQIGGSHPEMPPVATEQTAGRRVHRMSSAPRTKTILEFRIDRFIDVAGFMAFPILFVWLLAPITGQSERTSTLLFTIFFCGIGVCYYVWPDTPTRRKKHSRAEHPSGNDPDAVETEEKHGPYLLDFIIILSVPVALLCYLLCLIWQHRVLDLKSLVAVAIGFPVGIVIVTYLCKWRFIRATKLRVPKPPAFVPLSLLGLWLVGTFVSVVFLVCLVYRLKWLG